MDYVTLGSTGITVNKNGFGALPVQRISEKDAAYLLRKAFDNGITFFDTANFYTDSEKKIGIALSDVREKIVIATKTMPENTGGFWAHLHNSLKMMKTDYVDIYQFHNPALCPKPGDESGLYEAMLEAKEQGKVRHIGLTNHRIAVAREAAQSGLYEIIQFPVSYLASKEELEYIGLCRSLNIGMLAMKALAGGLITNSAAAYAFLIQFDNVLPIWGIQRESELDEFISYQSKPPVLNEELKKAIEKDIEELSGDFCRCCGYCMPCPAGIQLPNAARMSQLMRRAPAAMWDTEFWRENMKLIDDCINCGHCKQHCPYSLDVPDVIRRCREDYESYIISGK